MAVRTTKRGRRPKIQGAYKVKVISDEGRAWIEERCWRCGRVLKRHPISQFYFKVEQMNCPSCKALNIVEVED